MSNNSQQTRWHHLGTAAGLCGLMLWFYIGRRFGVLDWAARQLPDEYGAVGVTLAVMLMMLPAFLIWNRYNRWLERRLGIQGRYLEEEVYRPKVPDANTQNTTDTRQP